MLSAPILLITFNRPEHTERVLATILEAQPKDLYVFQDGARDGNENDLFKCDEVRRVIGRMVAEKSIALHTYYSSVNYGCGAGPMTALNWFFGQVNEGIVIEDDCLPHPDFFKYSEELLERFRDDERVRFINSTLYDNRWQCDASYGFSHYMVTGAWAGWKRTWEGYDLDIKKLNARLFRKHVLELTDNLAEANWWFSIVKEIQQDESIKSYWDYQMQIHLFQESALTIHPRVNLVSNIGFDDQGTHTLDNSDKRGGRPVFPILPLDHPKTVYVDRTKDAQCWAKANSRGWVKDTLEYCYQSLLLSKGLGHRLLMVYKRIKGVGINTYKV